MADSRKQHYHLVSALIMFVGENEEIGSVPVNCTIVTDDRNVPSREIGRAQQVAQMVFFKKLPGDPPMVVDVIINAISYLGHMSQENFMAPPEGTKLQEQEKPAAPFDPFGKKAN